MDPAAVTAAAAAAYAYVDMTVYEDYLRPIYKDGDVVLEVECGDNRGLLYLSRLCQGSKGPCILFNTMWLTPNEFQYISGRETAKDWKRSIRHHGKSMKLLLSKGILAVHPPICDCDGCRISSPVSSAKAKCAKLIPSSSPRSTTTTPNNNALNTTNNNNNNNNNNNINNINAINTINAVAENRGRLAEKKPGPEGRRGNNGRKKALVGLPASGYSDHVHELQALIAQTQRQAQQLQKNMESIKKPNDITNKSPEPEKKRESRLTSIIDQLLSNKAKGLNVAKEGDVPVTKPPPPPPPPELPRHPEDSDVPSDDNSSEDRRGGCSSSSASSTSSRDSVSSLVSSESGQSEISTGSSLGPTVNGTANAEDPHLDIISDAESSVAGARPNLHHHHSPHPPHQRTTPQDPGAVVVTSGTPTSGVVTTNLMRNNNNSNSNSNNNSTPARSGRKKNRSNHREKIKVSSQQEQHQHHQQQQPLPPPPQQPSSDVALSGSPVSRNGFSAASLLGRGSADACADPLPFSSRAPTHLEKTNALAARAGATTSGEQQADPSDERCGGLSCNTTSPTATPGVTVSATGPTIPTTCATPPNPHNNNSNINNTVSDTAPRLSPVAVHAGGPANSRSPVRPTSAASAAASAHPHRASPHTPSPFLPHLPHQTTLLSHQQQHHHQQQHSVYNPVMPSDALVVDASKIKAERLTPPDSHLASPHHHPNHHHHHLHHPHLLHPHLSHLHSLGSGGLSLLDSGSSPSPSPSPRSPASLAGSLRAAAFPQTPPPVTTGLDAHFPTPLLGCGTPPVLKQMEQMVTRNYSDIMRSLAAKYNNSNPDRFNGFERKYDGRFPTPPLLGMGNKETEGVRKNENHSAPPVLGEQRPASGGITSLPMMDMSSTQALLNMVRSATAQSASQLETYLRGAIKRPGESEAPRSDPLDLTVSSKRPRMSDGLISAGGIMGGALSPYDAAAMAASLSMRLPGGGTVTKPIRDFRDLLGTLKRDSGSDGNEQLSAASTPNANTPASSPRLHDGKTPPSKGDCPLVTPSRNKSTGSVSTASTPSSVASSASSLAAEVSGRIQPCLSLCTDRGCGDESEASDVSRWTVDDVCRFVSSIDTCSEYVQTFREQSIDGAALPMLTEEHLINNMNMKLGPVLKLRATLAKKIGHCAICMHCIHCHGNQSERRPEST